ncbi:hypothetical protein FQA39_LY12403 [Lamprigera yunnana]|nr:hypothetical protein FQA39_LY12403 [Lamprigera yunnana]
MKSMCSEIKIIKQCLSFNEDGPEDSELTKLFPFTTQEQLEHFNTTVTEKILELNLSESYNWCGKNNKPAFNHFKNIINFVVGVVRKNKFSRDATQQEVETIIKSWLRTATDRNGGRNKRRSVKKYDVESLQLLVRWKDNNIVTIATNYDSFEPLGKVKQWSKERKEKVDVPQPMLFAAYNAGMGWVDLLDQVVTIEGKNGGGRFGLMLNVSVVNAWRLHLLTKVVVSSAKQHYALNKTVLLIFIARSHRLKMAIISILMDNYRAHNQQLMLLQWSQEDIDNYNEVLNLLQAVIYTNEQHKKIEGYCAEWLPSYLEHFMLYWIISTVVKRNICTESMLLQILTLHKKVIVWPVVHELVKSESKFGKMCISSFNTTLNGKKKSVFNTGLNSSKTAKYSTPIKSKLYAIQVQGDNVEKKIGLS